MTGSHSGGRINDIVLGIDFNRKTIRYFPHGLEKYFKDLRSIDIYTSKLKEIHQSDLKPFTKLVTIYLRFNEIEILEEGLFDFNPDLEYISIYNNRISEIYPNIFDNLRKLTSLYLGSNNCINMDSDKDSEKTKNIIERVKRQCPTADNPITCSKYISEISVLKQEIEALKKIVNDVRQLVT